MLAMYGWLFKSAIRHSKRGKTFCEEHQIGWKGLLQHRGLFWSARERESEKKIYKRCYGPLRARVFNGRNHDDGSLAQSEVFCVLNREEVATRKHEKASETTILLTQGFLNEENVKHFALKFIHYKWDGVSRRSNYHFGYVAIESSMLNGVLLKTRSTICKLCQSADV